MAGEWAAGTLGDIADLVMGQSPTGDTCNVVGRGFPLLNGPTEFGGNHPKPVQFTTDPRKFAEPGDLLFCVRGSTTGRMNWADQRYAIGRGLAAIRAKEGKEYRHFVRAVIDVNLPWLLASATGSTFPNVSRDQIQEIECSVPTLAEQRAIASVLEALDDKIELNRRMNATLEAMARALFQSWFVDFEPVRAKLDGRQLGDLDPGTAALFPDSFQDSELGHIPTGWKVTTLGACIGFRSGFSFKSQDWQESGVPVVKIGSVKPGIIDLSQVSYVSEEIAHQASRYRLSTGDMLIGMTGYVGEVGLVPPSTNPPLLNQRVGKFVMPKAGTESLAFWYCTSRQPEFRAFVEARSHGTAQANVSGDAIMQFPLVAPMPEILDAFNRECQPMLDHILSNHAESCTLATLRDTLLPKLLSGEMSVAEVDKEVFA
jgi:type I restriction enzyme S subunit